MNHHTTESVERLAKRYWDNTELRATIVFPLHDECAKTLRDLAAERDAMRARLDEAERDHLANHRMMELVEDECRTIGRNAVAINNIRYAAAQVKDRSAKYCAFLNGGGNGGV